MNITTEELKNLLGKAFQYGNETYFSLKEECVEKIVEEYLKNKPQITSDQFTVTSSVLNSNPAYYSYFGDGVGSITLGQTITTTNTEEIF